MRGRALLLGVSCCRLYNCRLYSPQFRRIYDMSLRKVVVTHESETMTVGLSFRYQDEGRNVDRIFNLQRSTQDELGNTLARISGNILKAVFKKKKNKKSEDFKYDEIPVKMLRVDNEESVPEDMTCYDSFVVNSKSHNLIIGDIQYAIDLNPPVVKTVDLPKNMMAGFPVYPNKLEVAFAEKEQCIFKWFKSDIKFETDKVANAHLNKIKWIELEHGLACRTTCEDVGRLFKVVVTPYMGERRGEDAEVVSSVLVSAGPGECPFERRHEFTKNMAGNNSLRVISYNILAELYADSDHARNILFSSCPPYALDLDYRKQLLIKEILGYNGDLICLQEVDEKVFNRDLLPALGSQGLEGHYTAKGGQVTEGCTIFCRKNKLRILEQNRFLLSAELQNNILFADMWEEVQTSPDLTLKMTQRSTVLQVSVIESVENPSKLIVVGITHLYFHPDADHIRLLQAGICIKLLQQVLSLYETKHPEKEVSLIFCGDFNSTPEFEVYRLMTTQLVDFDDIDWSGKESEFVKNIRLSHNLELDSACGCPPYTNYTTGFYGCLDYIFYQTDKFIVKQVIPMPSHEEVTEHVAIPSITFPSDHIALIADLEFKET
ncbi:2',5'-phosphodiesterase 12 [Procambarus clarkii]|uniref:2',5'-phosphodiesterase 12 n=1 Tax=Procambarus clarkii TaxID=6728 RepID=UPI0037440DCC